MRTIKFRGIRVNQEFDKGFKYGNLLNECSIGEVGVGLSSYSYTEVIPETVGQFTGLTDKNGKEIYEGDVVHDEMYTYKIYWDDEDCGFRMEANGDGEILYLSDYEPSSLIIYGNIHENPELIK